MSLRPTSQRAVIVLMASIIGVCLYAVSIYVTSIIDIPGSDDIQVRPG
jgi:hypothetical protein